MHSYILAHRIYYTFLLIDTRILSIQTKFNNQSTNLKKMSFILKLQQFINHYRSGILRKLDFINTLLTLHANTTMADGQSKLLFPLLWDEKNTLYCFQIQRCLQQEKEKAYHCTFLQGLASNLKRLRSNTAILQSLQVHLNGIPSAD